MTTDVLEAQRLADRDADKADKMVLADKIGLAVPRPSGEANPTDERAGSSSEQRHANTARWASQRGGQS